MVVIWSGASRHYLTVTDPPAAPPARVSAARSSEATTPRAPEVPPRLRLRHAARTAHAPFTVVELAQTARVSKTLVRRFLARARGRGECRLVGRRPRARTFADVFVFTAAGVIDVPPAGAPSLTRGARGEGA